MNEFILTSTVNDLILARWDLKLLQAKMQAMIDAQAAQQVRQPLTHEKLEAMWDADMTSNEDHHSLYYFKMVARAVEREHGIT